jgi:hypothetical protein
MYRAFHGHSFSSRIKVLPQWSLKNPFSMKNILKSWKIPKIFILSLYFDSQIGEVPFQKHLNKPQ